jgi:hypothetical protein
MKARAINQDLKGQERKVNNVKQERKIQEHKGKGRKTKQKRQERRNKNKNKTITHKAC